MCPASWTLHQQRVETGIRDIVAAFQAHCRVPLYALIAIVSLLLGGEVAIAQGLVGALYVVTDPAEAAIYVNGELKGISPCGISGVPVGEVEVRAEKQGYAPVAQQVRVEGGKTSSLHMSLAPLTNVGTIAVLVEPPGARIELERIPAGRTPAVILNVPAGIRRVTVSAEGFRPLSTTVTVVAGAQATLKGQLAPLAALTPAAAADDVTELGRLDLENLPSVAELPEEAAFDPVRRLVSQRQYTAALEELDKLAKEDQARRYSLRIGLMRRMIRRMQDVVDAGLRQLRGSVGREFMLDLRKGIRLAGTVVDVTDAEVILSVMGVERKLPLDTLSADQIIRLAAEELDANNPNNMASFAALYAAECQFQQAYDQLRKAANTQYDISQVRSYVDSEHLWAAVVDREEAQRVRARMGAAPARLEVDLLPPVKLLVDTYHGDKLATEIEALLRQNGFELSELARPLVAADAAQPFILVLRDRGLRGGAPPHARQEVQLLMDNVRAGGAFVFFGASSPTQPRSNLSPGAGVTTPPATLLWCGIAVREEELALSDRAPDDYPRLYALCFPVARHPITYGVRRVVMPLSSPSLGVENQSWVMLRASPLVSGKSTGELAPPMVAARELGRGRVVAFANMPLLQTSPSEKSPFFANDAALMLLNAFHWASYPMRESGQ